VILQVDTGFDGEDRDHEQARKGNKRAAVADDMPVSLQRHTSWLRRGSSEDLSDKSWRPQTIYRAAARRWATNIDNQIRVSTAFPGLIHFKPDDSNVIWQDFRSWPGLGIAMDKGSDGDCAMNALTYHYGLNVWQWPDPSHGANRDFDLTLSDCRLKQFWLLMLISWNLPFGPDRDDQRYLQMRDAMKSYFRRYTKDDAVLFRELAASIISQHSKAGIMYPGEEESMTECWKYLEKRAHFAKVGRRTNLNRFMGSVETAEYNLPNWSTDLMERLFVSLECDFLTGRSFLKKLKLVTGAAEEVGEGGATTSTHRLTVEECKSKQLSIFSHSGFPSIPRYTPAKH
jgi:hypothetical protein